MSCGLVGEDFTAEYFLSRTSDNESGSEDSESSIDDSPDPDTDEESVSSDGNAPAPFQWQSMAQLAAVAHQVFANHAPAHLRLAREQDIIDRIVHFAMQADNNEIILPGRTGDKPRQTVATSLMCISHKLYHQCRGIMYHDNTFKVSKFGAGLRHLTKQLGFHYCGEVCSSTTAISSIHFELGCRDHHGMGMIKFDAFTQAIKDLNRPIATKHLRIDFLPFCFVGDRHLAAFADALKDKMHVDCVFEMTGLDVQWECNLRMIPQALGMKVQPLICDYEPHDDNQGLQGFFGCSYEPASNHNEVVGFDSEGNELKILDGRYFYERHELGLYQDI
ncbi:MAG: hypothetical protein LQ339_008132 [Xanthoria mediterranea]|nr:MAG: hypothetical protein LQ339_008132 [Xanthoria mediterranea]